MWFITKWWIRSFRTKCCAAADDGFTPKNSIGANDNIAATIARADGKNRISRGFCVKLERSQRFCAAGAGDAVSDDEGVVATFFLMRYQRVVASNRDINFTRQFLRRSFFITSVQ